MVIVAAGVPPFPTFLRTTFDFTNCGSRISGDGHTQFFSPFGQVHCRGACRIS